MRVPGTHGDARDTRPRAEVGCSAASSVWMAVRAVANCGWSRHTAFTVLAEELLRMNESIHGEGTASELQDRETELIAQQTAISEVLRAITSSPHDLQPSSTPSSTAPPIPVEQT
jgi:hypothetical protein